MKDGKLAPVAVIKGGKTTSYEDFVKASQPAPAAAVPVAAPAAAEPAKDAPKAEAKK
jgi:branched-chain amino acid transport system substrate-binding protein